MQGIRRFTEDIVSKAKNFSGDSVDGQFADLDARCPKCGTIPSRNLTRPISAKAAGLSFGKAWPAANSSAKRSRLCLKAETLDRLKGSAQAWPTVFRNCQAQLEN